MKKNLFVLLTALFFTFIYLPISFPRGEPVTITQTVPDADADYLISLRISEGKGLYSSFSILYPPGRFLIQALLFKIFSPTFAINHIFHEATAIVFFPAILFVFCYFFFLNVFGIHLSNRFRQFISPMAYVVAIITVYINLLFFRYAQEAHVITVIFFIVLTSSKTFSKTVIFLLGIILGLTFLFRVDAGIILTIAFFLSSFPVLLKKMKEGKTSRNIFFLGLLSIWGPLTVWLLLNGSLTKFLHDVLLLGLIVQPKFMSLPIPQNELKLVFLASLSFLTSSSIALFIDAKQSLHSTHKVGMKTFSIVGVLSYISALGRSDEPHLWYGLVWISPLVLYCICRAIIGLCKRERFSILNFFIIIAFVLVYSHIIIYFKSPFLFIFSISILFSLLQFISVPVFSTILAGCAATTILFHSISYLKLKMSLPSLPAIQLVSHDLLTSDVGEVGGLRIDNQIRYQLDQIRRDIPKDERFLFIFPNQLIWNEYFNLENPTRYIILAQERTSFTESEVIKQLEQTDTKYFLLFMDSGQLRKGPVWEWLLENTYTIQSYQLGEEQVKLNIKRTGMSKKPIQYWLQF